MSYVNLLRLLKMCEIKMTKCHVTIKKYIDILGQILYFRKMLKETNLEENMSSAKWKQLMRIYYDLLKNIWIIETY